MKCVFVWGVFVGCVFLGCFPGVHSVSRQGVVCCCCGGGGGVHIAALVLLRNCTCIHMHIQTHMYTSHNTPHTTPHTPAFSIAVACIVALPPPLPPLHTPTTHPHNTPKHTPTGAGRIEFSLSTGASRLEASKPLARAGLTAALEPMVGAMQVMGVVCIPELMMGQLLGGVYPNMVRNGDWGCMGGVCFDSWIVDLLNVCMMYVCVHQTYSSTPPPCIPPCIHHHYRATSSCHIIMPQAARYQILIAFTAMTCSSLAVLLITMLATATLLDGQVMLRGDKLVDRGDRKAGIEPWLHAQLLKVGV